MGDLAVELGFYPADWVGGDMSKGTHIERHFVTSFFYVHCARDLEKEI